MLWVWLRCPWRVGAKLKNAAVTSIGVSTPGAGFQYFVVDVILRLFGASPALAGGKPVNGKWQLQSRCFGVAGNTSTNHTVKIKDGNAACSGMIEGLGTCNFVDFLSTLKGNAVLPMPAETVIALSTVPVYPDSGCMPDGTTMCLGSMGRFQVEVDWRDGPGKSNEGVAFQEGADSGTFFFFAPENWEMLVKVLDGCSVNDRFWVFAAAATDAEYTVTVTDTESGSTRQYSNPLGTAAPAITDTEAFATCP